MATRNTKLSLDAKIYVVKSLACRERIPDILTTLQNDYGVTVDRKALAHYDPRINANLDADLKALYEKTSADFWSKKEFEPMNSLNYRQRLRVELYEQAARNPKLRLEILADAAKDEGAIFSNRREVTGADGAPLAGVTNVSTASGEEILQILACFPLELLPFDMAQLMVDRGLVPPERAKELPALRGEGDVEYVE